MAKTLAELGVMPANLTAPQAAAYLGISPRHFAKLKLPRVDMREAGADQPVWRYRRVDLDAYNAGRVVGAGANTPGQQSHGDQVDLRRVDLRVSDRFLATVGKRPEVGTYRKPQPRPARKSQIKLAERTRPCKLESPSRAPLRLHPT